MIEKERYNSDIEKMIEVSDKYEIEKLKEEFKLLLKESNEFKINILFIGSFSAGKSALLNRLIGKNILEESQAPETAIATELYNSEEEYIVLNKKDGSRKIITSELLEDDIENSKYIEYYVSSKNIKKLSDYTIVDTPGFDSGIERHNEALMQYIGMGTAYVLVIDVEKGTLSKSVLNFIEEIIGYESDIAIVLNKCDKKTEDEIRKIKLEIEKSLKLHFFTEMSLIETSIFDENVTEKLVTLISKFKPQDLYEKNIIKSFSNKIKMLLNGIELIRKNQEFDEEKYDKEIEEREKIKKVLVENLKDEKEEIKNNLNDKKKYEILDSVRMELISNTDKLAISYKGGEDLFKRRIVEIIRLEENSIDIEEIENLVTKLKELENDSFIKLPERNNHHIENFEKIDKVSSAYMGIASALAIATNVVAPALELVIVFLPLIIKLVKSITGSSEEEQLKFEIENKVIPEILVKLENQIEEILSKLGEEAIQSIDDKINEIINIENETLEKMKIKKLEKQEVFEKYTENINLDFKTVKEIGEKYDR